MIQTFDIVVGNGGPYSQKVENLMVIIYTDRQNLVLSIDT